MRGTNGYVIFAGWSEEDGERKFIAKVHYPDGPPSALTNKIIWNAIPIEITLTNEILDYKSRISALQAENKDLREENEKLKAVIPAARSACAEYYHGFDINRLAPRMRDLLDKLTNLESGALHKEMPTCE